MELIGTLGPLAGSEAKAAVAAWLLGCFSLLDTTRWGVGTAGNARLVPLMD